VTCDHVPRQDIDSFMHKLDLPNISLSGIGERSLCSTRKWLHEFSEGPG
jgi:hypothetical protein